MNYTDNQMYIENCETDDPVVLLNDIIYRQEDSLRRYAERNEANSRVIDIKNKLISELVKVYNSIVQVYKNPIIPVLTEEIAKLQAKDSELDSVHIILPLKLSDQYSRTGYLNLLEGRL